MKFLSRLFGRKTKTPVDRRGWSEDWKVGDRAQCIGDNWCIFLPDSPRRGDVLRVSGFRVGVESTGERIISALQFEGKSQNHAWAQKMFQKIRPAEQCFIETMERIKRKERAQ